MTLKGSTTSFKKMVKQQLLNVRINNITMQDVVGIVKKCIETGHKSYIVPVNVDMIVKSEDDEYLRQIINDADLTLADGKPLIWISAIKGKRLVEKISGSDLAVELLKLANENKYSIFIIGGKEGVAARAGSNIVSKYTNIAKVDAYSPPFGFENDENEIEKINSLINEAKPDMIFACFGCPKQEKWVYGNYKKYAAKVTLCAGATVDFLAGNVSRAPKWISNIGLEWFYRFLQEPRRLFKRYFIDDLKVIKLILKY